MRTHLIKIFLCAWFTYSHVSECLHTVSIAQNPLSFFWREIAVSFREELGTVWTLKFYCMSFHAFLVGAGRKLLVLLHCRYLIPWTASKAGSIVSKIQKNWCFPGKFEITKLIPEFPCISNKTTLWYVFREDPSKLFIVFHNPAWLVGLPDFYPPLLCSPYLRGVHTNAGQLCCQSPIRWFLVHVS